MSLPKSVSDQPNAEHAVALEDILRKLPRSEGMRELMAVIAELAARIEKLEKRKK